jgi:Mg-chelatase subunit ChlD
VDALGDKHMAVRRMAVAALKDYDDPRAVKPLIDALGKAEGLLAQEIDQVLYWYTGHAFQGDVKIWRKWFKHEGEAWIAKGDKTRHAPREVTHAGTTTASTYTTFYDIPTESKRIVFVLDRSGSMESKARHVPKGKSRPKPRPKPRGPITGDKRKSDKGKGKGKGKDEDDEEDGPIEGSTKLEIAKNKLAQTVERIHKDVHFGLVFYSTDVSVWQKPPSLLQASKRNKKDAIRWFSALEPSGSTSLFPALMRALEYADAFGAPGGKQRKKGSSGANTIFLLSDGSPTAPGGDKALPASEVAAQLRAFLEANEIYRCVVHTIGVGPSHNRSLMKRIASATGGEYRAVGVD